ncbi:MAG: hypothetical protein ABJC89_21995, partial [Acidobacteriota bacterium]
MKSQSLALMTCLLLGLTAPADSRQGSTPAGDALILITFDGARTEEIFGGLDRDVLQASIGAKKQVEEQPVYRQFWAATPEARRLKLMPFFWGTLMADYGSIAGNPRSGSTVTVTNRHRFSYPGYAEILLGEAHDDIIKSNDAIQNPYVTVLEQLKTRLGLSSSQAAAFASWEVFNTIVEHTPGALTVNAGFKPFDDPDPQVRALGRLPTETPTPWDSARHDVYTFRFAMAHLQKARPRVLYVAFDETDDWSHDGRYDRVLQTYARYDTFLQELWTWLQSQPEYRGRTHILITTDHGRGHTTAEWRNHGATVEGAQDAWMAFITPRMAQRGEWR